MVLIIVFFILLSRGLMISDGQVRVEEAMNSPFRHRRIAALKHIYHQGLEISRFHQYKNIIASSDTSELYWLIRALSVSHQFETIGDIVPFLKSKNAIIQCQALDALGKRKHNTVRHTILDLLKNSDHWYVQNYAYHALRNLGWKQPKSTIQY
jgi:hypothetical protein